MPEILDELSEVRLGDVLEFEVEEAGWGLLPSWPARTAPELAADMAETVRNLRPFESRDGLVRLEQRDLFLGTREDSTPWAVIQVRVVAVDPGSLGPPEPMQAGLPVVLLVGTLVAGIIALLVSPVWWTEYRRVERGLTADEQPGTAFGLRLVDGLMVAAVVYAIVRVSARGS